MITAAISESQALVLLSWLHGDSLDVICSGLEIFGFDIFISLFFHVGLRQLGRSGCTLTPGLELFIHKQILNNTFFLCKVSLFMPDPSLEFIPSWFGFDFGEYFILTSLWLRSCILFNWAQSEMDIGRLCFTSY